MHIMKIVSVSINRYNVQQHEIVQYDLCVIVSVQNTFVFRKHTRCVEFINRLNYWKYSIGATCTKKEQKSSGIFYVLNAVVKNR